MATNDIFGTLGPNQNVITDPITGNRSFMDQQTIVGKPGWSQLGATPEDFARQTGFLGMSFDPSTATRDDRYGWIAPTSNVNPILSEGNRQQTARNNTDKSSMFAWGLPLAIGTAGTVMAGGGLAGGAGAGEASTAGAAYTSPFENAYGSWGVGEGATGGTAGGTVAGGSNPLADMNFPQNGPMMGNDVNMTGFSNNPVGSFGNAGAQVTEGISPYVSQGAGATGGASTNPFMNVLNNINDILGTGKNPITMGDIGKFGANYLLQSSLAGKYSDAANHAAELSNPLNSPQRLQYQNQLSQLLTNPQQFYSTNPVVQAQLDLARQQFMANTGKMGTGGTQFNDYLKNVQNVAAGTFNDQANILSGLGGFNQGLGFTGNNYANLAGQGFKQSEAYNVAYGKLLDKIFNSANPNERSLS